MTAVLAILGRTWKVWAPALAFVLIAGTIYAQHSRIKSLKLERDVAVVEHDRAVEEQAQLMADIDRLDALLLRREAQAQQLERSLTDAKKRIAALAAKRPLVGEWLDAALPDGLWPAVRGDSPGQGAAGTDGAVDSAGGRAEDKRGSSEPVPGYPQSP